MDIVVMIKTDVLKVHL